MSDQETQIYHKRQFLNERSGMAAIEANVSMNAWEERATKERRVSISGSMTISDCNRNVSLDLDASDKESAKNTLTKLDRLIAVATEVRKKLATTVEKEKAALR